MKDGHAEARRLYPDPIFCEWPGCGAPAERHHKDANPLNNARDNIEFLCKPHHIARDARFSRSDSRAALSAAMSGRTLSEQHKQRVGAALRGRPKSLDHRAKLSAALLGRPTGPKPPRTPSHCAKLSAANRGRIVGPQSDVTKSRISEALKASWARRKGEANG